MSSYSYAVRITRSYDVLKDLVYVWAERCERVAVYEHVGRATEKTHIHLVLSGCNVCKKQLKNLIKIHNIATQGALGGNKDWSFKDWDGDLNACAYMAKGSIEPSYLKGWTMEDHKKWLEMWRGGKYESADADYYACCFHTTEFMEAYDNWFAKRSANPYAEFNFIRAFAKHVVFDDFGKIWNLQAINRYKMLVYSYCYRNNVMIPQDKNGVFKEY